MSALKTLSTEDKARRSAAKTAKVSLGQNVELWEVEGIWHVWANAPERGHYWIAPADETARAVLAETRETHVARAVLLEVSGGFAKCAASAIHPAVV